MYLSLSLSIYIYIYIYIHILLCAVRGILRVALPAKLLIIARSRSERLYPP